MAITTALCGQRVTLLPERALFWHEAATLFVADLHLGKADAFLRAGIPIPPHGAFADLDLLARLLRTTAAERLVVLGDFFHAAGSRSPAVLEALAQWRSELESVEMALVTGNHDLHAGPPPAALGFACFDALHMPPFWCVHAPPAYADTRLHGEDERPYALPQEIADTIAADGGYTLCGHVHPYVNLTSARGAGMRAQLRLPCFHMGARQMILPAFGHFTGGAGVRVQAGDRVFAIAGGQVMECAVQERTRARRRH